MTRPVLVTCFGGGGGFGLGFNLGVAEGMRQAGVDVRAWPMIGTSAGAHAAAALGSGLTFEQVAPLWERYIEDQTRQLWVDAHQLASPIYGGRTADDVGAVAVRLPWLRREVLRSDEHPLDDIVAASSAVVVITRPHRVGRHRYLDGGTVSIASADLAPAADLMLLVTPFAVRGQGAGGPIGRWQARREIRRWTARHGGDVLHVVPNERLAALSSSSPRHLGDMSRGRAAYPLAFELGGHVGELLAAERPVLRSGPR